MTDGINPYQPVVIHSEASVSSGDEDVWFSATRAQFKFAESQFLLRRYSYRLFFGSLVMILCSVAAIVITLARFDSPLGFVAALLGSMGISTCLYLAMVHRAKARIRQRLLDHGLQHDVQCSLRLDSGRLELSTPLGVYAWDTATLKAYRTRKGLLVCPEPFLYAFIPKRSDFRDGDYNAFCARLFGR
ncbi:hypothetical protein Pla52o_18510 [Novipirellula galeiformis]|uniref:YcxB-like protein domain-containing protein n=1 Tax=Novipirellula galeiformis TaxID=2528004 RepID=A0A5C6CHS0_9BACT|nr:hypothetical protein [Novipirellula galeiformis]TWU23928.1 hypothetical protein Pla52o_18510 [Novipirellula galeiformis]